MATDRKQKSIGINVIWNGILSLSSILFPIITFPYMTRVLGVETNGAISFATSVVNYFALFATLGLSSYGVKACAQVKDDRDQLSIVTQELLMISSIAAIIVLAVLYLSLWFVPQFKGYRSLMMVYSVNIVLNVLGMNWMYQGIEKYKYITTRSIAFKIISIVLMFLFVKKPSDGVIYAIISVFAVSAGNILNIIYSHNYISFKRYNEYRFRRHLKPIFILFATTLAINVYSHMDTVMLGLYHGDYATGIYSVAVKVKTILLTLISSFSLVMMSRLSYVGRNSENSMYGLLQKSYELLLFVTIPICTYFTFFSRESVIFLSGVSFEEASAPMRILMPTIIISSVSQIVGSQYSVSIGKEKNLMIAVVTGAIVNVIFNSIFIPKLSYNGAAIGTLIAEATQCSIQIFFAWQMVKQVFTVKALGKVVIGTGIAYIVSLTFNSTISISGSFWVLSINACLFFSVYAIVMIILKYELCLSMLQLVTSKILKKVK